MSTSKQKLYAQRFRKATFDELVEILTKVEGVSSAAAVDLATVVFMCAPPPPELRDLWQKAAEPMKGLRDWLVEYEHNPLAAGLVNRLLVEYGFEEYRIWEGGPKGLVGPAIAPDMSHKEKPGYPALVKLGVDILCRHGLVLGATAKRTRGSAAPTALETMSRVLYRVWRDPDERAEDKHRQVGTLARRYREACRWAKERERQGRRLPTIDELEVFRMAEIPGKHVVTFDVVKGATANARHYVWIPERDEAVKAPADSDVPVKAEGSG
jgi:hypothetical protein